MDKTLGEKRKKAVLKDSEILKICTLIQQVEDFYEMPIDIEWAFADGKLYLLQARPITAYFKVPTPFLSLPGKQRYAYIDSMIIKQGLIEPLSVLGMDALMGLGEIFGAQSVIAKDPK